MILQFVERTLVRDISWLRLRFAVACRAHYPALHMNLWISAPRFGKRFSELWDVGRNLAAFWGATGGDGLLWCCDLAFDNGLRVLGSYREVGRV